MSKIYEALCKSENTNLPVRRSDPQSLPNYGRRHQAISPFTELNPVDASASVAQFLKILRRQRWTLLVSVGFAVAVAIAIQLIEPKLYEASALVQIDRHSAGGVVGQEASQVSPVDDMEQVITTQIEVAQSDPVLRPVAEQYHLLDVEGQLKGLSEDQARRKLAAPIELKRLKITRPPNSYLLRIAYRAHTPQLAADVANGIAQSMSTYANDSGKRSSEEIAGLFAQSMLSLRAKMDASAMLLEGFEKELNMLNPDQGVTIQAARLAQLETDFTTAQTERIHREAILAQVQGSGTLASAQAAQAAVQDNLLNDTIQRLDAARQQFALVRSYYGENHPEYVKAEQQVKEVESQLAEQKASAVNRATAEYQEALGRENRLRGLVQQTKAEVDTLNAHVHQYEQLRSDAESDKKLYEDLETRTRIADINEQFDNATVQIVAPALAPQQQVFPKLSLNLELALAASGICGILWAVLYDALDTTFSDPEGAANQLHLDVLATIPTAKQLPEFFTDQPVLTGGKSLKRSAELTLCYGEAIRALRSSLHMATLERAVRSVLITSAVSGEGKSTTASHLAVACAQLGKKVLLVDGDLRNPVLHKQFGVNNCQGLSDVLVHDVPYKQVIVELKQSGVFLMPAGSVSRRASDLLGLRFPAILDEVCRDFELVILDAPPMLGAPESQEFARIADSVVLVTKASATSAKAVSGALSLLLRARANVIGLVINQVKLSGDDSYGCYYRYSDPTDVEAPVV